MSQESIYTAGETYTSARATPELVGRGNVLTQIDQAIRDTSQSYIIYITGRGGIGKTRLVKHVLKNPPRGIPLVAAADLIDLYHTRVHSLAGLIGAILGVIEPLAEFYRSRLAEAEADMLAALARAEQEGLSMAEVISRRKETTAFFLDVLNQFTEQHRLVLALDTAERLLVERDPAQQALGLTEERPAILDWLLSDLLPNVRNTVVLLAGRPGPGNLRQELAGIENKKSLAIDLTGLGEDEAVEYFEAVIRRAEASDDPRDAQVAEAVRQWPDEDRRAIFYCLCDEGDPPTIRPILLALAIDYLAVAGRPLSALTRPLSEARALTFAEREAIRDELGQALVQVLHENRRPADEVIRALGWLRKGADAELLARVAGLERAEVEKALNDIRDLSFVKIRPADNRVFLHDEMYSLLERFALGMASDAERERVFKALQEYYDERIEQARDEIAELYRPLAEPALPEPARVAAARARLQDALVEDLHYRLRRDAAQGFQTYFRYAEEAIAAHDESLDVQLRAEMLSFLSERDPSGKAEEIDGLRRADVVADAAVRWVKRLTEGGRYADALRIAEHLCQEARELIEAGGGLAAAELDVWKGLACTYTGDYENAEKLLVQAEKTLEQMQVPENQLVRWSAILARAYNNVGYLSRVQGRFIAAVEAYQRALPHWRYVKIEAEQANTLTNLAFASALRGGFGKARRYAQDALTLRERLGHRVPVVLACNALAEIETLAGHLVEAEPHAQRALSLSQALGFERGKGLALLTLAAIRRFRSEYPGLSLQDRVSLLNQALASAKDAAGVFSRVQEPEQEIKALYEQGLASRELCRVAGPETKSVYAKEAEEYLGQARKRAKEEGLWLLYLDGSLGLAWTYYYNNDSKLKGILKEVDKDIEEHFSDYQIKAGKLPEVKGSMLAGVFGQLARLHVLRGVLAMDAFEKSDKQPPYPALQEAAHEFVLTLEYDAIVENQQGTRRALNTIYNRLKKLNTRELKAFYDAVETAAVNLGWDREDCHLWQEVENAFGPYEVIRRLAI